MKHLGRYVFCVVNRHEHSGLPELPDFDPVACRTVNGDVAIALRSIFVDYEKASAQAVMIVFWR